MRVDFACDGEVRMAQLLLGEFQAARLLVDDGSCQMSERMTPRSTLYVGNSGASSGNCC